MTRIGIVAALEREIAPLVRNPAFRFRRQEVVPACWQNEHLVVVCGGIGYKRARSAAEGLARAYKLELLVSAGFAGALVAEHPVGRVLLPGVVLDAGSGLRYATRSSQPTTLVTVAEVTAAADKATLRQRTGADMVDMEAAAVARVAVESGLPFLAVKSISDSLEQRMPPLERFVRDGELRVAALLAWAAVRPLWWPVILELARHAAIASRKLCLALGALVLTEDWMPAGLPPDAPAPYRVK